MAGIRADSFPSPRGRLSTNGSMGHHSELQLPDGDDLLGMTAHTPTGAPMVRSGTTSIDICLLCLYDEDSKLLWCILTSAD